MSNTDLQEELRAAHARIAELEGLSPVERFEKWAVAKGDAAAAPIAVSKAIAAEAFKQGATTERAAIVSWLRALPGDRISIAEFLKVAADIESLAHHLAAGTGGDEP